MTQSARRYNRQSSRFPVVAVLFLLALLICGGGAAAWFLLSSEGKTTDATVKGEANPAEKGASVKAGKKEPAPAPVVKSPAEKLPKPPDLSRAVILQAPLLDRSDPGPIRGFTGLTRGLAAGEKEKEYPEGTIFHTAFHRKIQNSPGPLQVILGRNVIVQSGKYDEVTKQADWSFCLWYHFIAATPGDAKAPEDIDVCLLQGSFKQTPDEARRWLQAYVDGTLVVDLWYRLRAVETRQWQRHPRLPSAEGGPPETASLSHRIVFEVEILKAELMPENSPLPPATEVALTEREKLFLGIDRKYRQLAEQTDAKMREYDVAKAAYDARSRADPGNPALFPELNRLNRMLKDIGKQIELNGFNWQQEVREVMLNNPRPGDPKLAKHRGLIYTEPELASVKLQEETLQDPRKVAEAHIRKLRQSGTVLSATYDGIVYLDKEKNTAGVCFQLDIEVNGRPFANKAWYLNVKKVKEFWEVVPVVGDGAELLAGVPKGTKDKTGTGSPVR